MYDFFQDIVFQRKQISSNIKSIIFWYITSKISVYTENIFSIIRSFYQTISKLFEIHFDVPNHKPDFGPFQNFQSGLLGPTTSAI